jgi:ABC-2 type transport system permease protein
VRAGRLRTLLQKELLDLGRNRAALFPVAFIAVVALGLPFVIALVTPALTGQHLGDEPDLAKVSLAIGTHLELSADGRVQLFLFQQFLLVFLLMPITGAMALAAHAVVGEKQARTLEPLLATPVTTTELLMAKVLGALLPTLAISAAGLMVYLLLIWWFAEAGVAAAMMSARTAVLVAVVGPGAALVALQAALLISSRTQDPRTALQFGVLIIIPLTALLIAQFTGAFWLSATALAFVGLGLFGVWILLTGVSITLFEREAILTRWR